MSKTEERMLARLDRLIALMRAAVEAEERGGNHG
jgi:hypothetical protein